MLLLSCVVASASAQKRIDQYTASNGITYHEGDTVLLGRGSGPGGSFSYITVGGWAASTQPQGIGAGYSGLAVTINKIKQYTTRGQTKVWFVVAGGNITNYNLIIEDAIAVCEVVPCASQAAGSPSDKYDDLKKLKDLLDQGVITEEEFSKEKAKILE